MISTTQADAIRRKIHDHFRQFGASPDDSLQESILIRQGLYCGRRFEMGPFSAVWFVEENELKFYDAEGTVLAVQSPAHSSKAIQKAA